MPSAPSHAEGISTMSQLIDPYDLMDDAVKAAVEAAR